MKKSIYIFNDGEIHRKDNTIYFKGEEGKKYLPVEDIGEICIIGEVGTSKKFLEFCTSNHIVIHYYNYHEYYVGSYYPREHYNSGYMILNQAGHYIDIGKRKCLALKFIQGGVLNILNVLKYYYNRGKDVGRNIEYIIQSFDKLDISMDIEQMMAIEGNIREVYYAAFDDILEDSIFSFDVRSKRPPLNKCKW